MTPDLVRLVDPGGLPPPLRAEADGVAEILAKLQLDAALTWAGMAVPLVAGGVLPLDGLPERIGEEASRLVREVLAVPLLESVGDSGGTPPSPAQAENLRKLLLAIIGDARVLVVVLARRLHALRAARQATPLEQQRLAAAVREIYAPLASRLGIWQLKWELEDLAFRYLEPGNYRQVAEWLNQRRTDRETSIAETVQLLAGKLQAAGIAAEVSGRPKHIYSIWRKLQRKQLEFTALSDVRAVRVLVDNVADCYAALGVVHGLWRHIPGEFDDYITRPKDNFYRSLHTAVIAPDGRPLEIQIRTHEMHQHAELGVAAHWRYKEGGRFDAGLEARLGWMRQLLAPGGSDADFIDRFRAALVDERVYVLTPKGAVLDLPRGATVLDFAYYIHSDIGHRCRGARVDGRLVPLTQRLESGQQVEILTSREAEPSRDWLNPLAGFLATNRARDKVRAFFRGQERGLNTRYGRETLERELERLGLRDFGHERLLSHFHFAALDDLFAAVGAGDVTAAQVAGAVQHELALETPAITVTPPLAAARQARKSVVPAVTVAGVDNLLTSLARCCHPLPGEALCGYVTRGHGITVHRMECASLKRLLARNPERAMAATWQGRAQTYPVRLTIEAQERRDLLSDLTAVIANEKIRVLALQTRLVESGSLARLHMTLAIADLAQLSRLLARLSRVPGVLRAVRDQGS
ncbi:MAG: bifunctional (p)ppGpp synthetase/guanosine-3',5'-bis(diphosphate) 3'-pyrophosphohydrolase [Gammaproteobacteria bacterium]|nr:bifunctional (p)ppGpp synthetase/guanosine-3',5'-bis(diphosphate) 3'-pyrophosphohydrolase [Gammaproteobacteria bacterium]